MPSDEILTFTCNSDRHHLGAVLPSRSPVILAVAFLFPTGLELSGSWLGWPSHRTWEQLWRADPAGEAALVQDVSRTDAAGAGGSSRRSSSPPARSATPAMADLGYPGDEARRESYMERRFDPAISALLVNGRPIYLGLYDIQGYNPLHLSRYDEFMTASTAHRRTTTAFLLPSGLRSAARSARRSLHRAGRRFAPYRDDVRDLARDAGGISHAAGHRPRARLRAASRLDRARCATRDPRRGVAPPDQRSRSLSDGARRGGPPVTAMPEEPRPSRHESPRTNRTG